LVKISILQGKDINLRVEPSRTKLHCVAHPGVRSVLGTHGKLEENKHTHTKANEIGIANMQYMS